MQTSVLKELFITIFLGLLVGALTAAFLRTLRLIADQHEVWNAERWPPHLFFLPLVLLLVYLLKKRTLYFPTKVSELIAWKSESCWHWSAWMTPLKFIGTLMSHVVGASVGRESVAVVMAAGIIRVFRLDWRFWGPIAMGCGFSAVLGNPWIGLIFVGELIATNIRQKILLLIAAYFSFLLMQTLQIPHLIAPVEIQQELSFFSTLFFVLALAVSVGFMMRFYKWAFLRMSAFFQVQSIWLRLGFSVILAGLLMIEKLRPFQSLGILQIENLEKLPTDFQIPFLKLFLTLFSVTLGFWGGEFVPLVYTGLHYGASLAHAMGYPQMVGTYLAAFLFFASATRLKWTAFFLLLSLMGFSWCIWLVVLVNLTVGFSGDESLYRPHD